VFKSADGGASWSATGAGPTNVYAMAMDPTNPNTLYAGTSGGGVFKSTDGGANWSAANSGLTNLSIYSLAINPTMLYAGTWYGGAFALQHRARVFLPLVLRNP
jgi:photosystem II stability/assembly factor-like uncharacterized protein